MKTILVVDDNKLNLATARNVLKDEYRVISVMRGEQALTYLESGECDIILLDINMPDMDGFEVMDRIRKIEHCRNTPVVFLTADSDAENEARCFEKGALDFIAKPYVPNVMLSRIGRILELEDLRRNLADKLEQKTREVSDFRSKSLQDPLTGLWNRLYAEESINEMLERGEVGALMMIDIDNFKLVNDVYGHIAGDKTLKMFADVLEQYALEGDILSRIGGDEFVFFVKGVTEREKLSERAINIIAEFYRGIDAFGFDLDLKTSISIGIAQTPDNGKDFLSLYNCADKALYYVKQNGKNSHHFYNDKIQSGSDRDGKTVDLKYLQELMSRADTGTGVYQLDFDSFNRVYNFIRRFVDRSDRDVQTVLFTVNEVGSAGSDASETEYALELLEKAVYTSLRRSDVSTRYSSKQLIVILMDANSEIGDMVAERILDNFNKLYTNGKVRVDFGIARMSGKRAV